MSLEEFFGAQIPEEMEDVLCDPITESLMRKPVFCFGRTFDYSTLERNQWRNPFSPSETTDSANVQANISVATMIDQFMDKQMKKYIPTLFSDTPQPDNITKIVDLTTMIKDRSDRTSALNGGRLLLQQISTHFEKIFSDLCKLSFDNKVHFLTFIKQQNYAKEYAFFLDKQECKKDHEKILENAASDQKVLIQLLLHPNTSQFWQVFSLAQIQTILEVESIFANETQKQYGVFLVSMFLNQGHLLLENLELKEREIIELLELLNQTQRVTDEHYIVLDKFLATHFASSSENEEATIKKDDNLLFAARLKELKYDVLQREFADLTQKHELTCKKLGYKEKQVSSLKYKLEIVMYMPPLSTVYLYCRNPAGWCLTTGRNGLASFREAEAGNTYQQWTVRAYGEHEERIVLISQATQREFSVMHNTKPISIWKVIYNDEGFFSLRCIDKKFLGCTTTGDLTFCDEDYDNIQLHFCFGPFL